MEMKKQLFNSSELGMLSSAFLKNLFPKPNKGQLMSKCENGDCILYFDLTYHEKLDLTIRQKYYEGQFAKSNAESEWNNLMIKVNTAELTDEDTSDFDTYWLSAN